MKQKFKRNLKKTTRKKADIKKQALINEKNNTF